MSSVLEIEHIEWHEDAFAEIRAADYVRGALHDAGLVIAQTMADAAPHRTGSGAASIGSESVFAHGEWEEHIAWDRAHYYMGFQDLGTRFDPALHFLEDTVARYAPPLEKREGAGA